MLQHFNQWLTTRGFLSRTGFVLLLTAVFLTAVSFFAGVQVLMFAPAFVLALFLYSFVDVYGKKRHIGASWKVENGGVRLHLLFRRNFDFSYFFLAVDDGKHLRFLMPDGGFFFQLPKHNEKYYLILQGRLDVFRARIPLPAPPEAAALLPPRDEGGVYFLLRPLEDGDDMRFVDAMESAKHDKWYIRERIEEKADIQKATKDSSFITVQGSSSIAQRKDVHLGYVVEWSMIINTFVATLLQWADPTYSVAIVLSIGLVVIWKQALKWPSASGNLKNFIALVLFFGSLTRGIVAGELLMSLAYFLLLLAIWKRLFSREPRDTFFYVFLVLFVFVALSLYPLKAWFFVLFFIFLLQAVALFSLYAAGKQEEDYRASFGRPKTARTYLFMNVWIVSLTFLLFFLLPHSNHPQDTSLIEGFNRATVRFSDEVSLGDVRQAKQDFSKQFVVEKVDPVDLAALTRTYWRGMRFTHFNGTSWENGGLLFLPFANANTDGLSTKTLAMKYFLDGEDFLFTPGAPLAVGGTQVKAASNDLSLFRFFDLQYLPVRASLIFQKDSEGKIIDLSRPKSAPTAPQTPETEKLFADFWKSLPPELVNNPQKLTDYIKNDAGFSYSLLNPSVDMKSFLYGEKRGYCEFYATVLAVTLQHFGYPATLVSGYAGGEWNDASNSWIVRGSNAHSWVEIPDAQFEDWRILDPTPDSAETFFPLRSNGYFASFTKAYDALELTWLDYVVGFTAERQKELLLKLLTVLPLLIGMGIIFFGGRSLRHYVTGPFLSKWRQSPEEKFISWLRKKSGVDAFVLQELEKEFPDLVAESRTILYGGKTDAKALAMLKNKWKTHLGKAGIREQEKKSS